MRAKLGQKKHWTCAHIQNFKDDLTTSDKTAQNDFYPALKLWQTVHGCFKLGSISTSIIITIVVIIVVVAALISWHEVVVEFFHLIRSSCCKCISTKLKWSQNMTKSPLRFLKLDCWFGLWVCTFSYLHEDLTQTHLQHYNTSYFLTCGTDLHRSLSTLNICRLEPVLQECVCHWYTVVYTPWYRFMTLTDIHCDIGLDYKRRLLLIYPYNPYVFPSLATMRWRKSTFACQTHPWVRWVYMCGNRWIILN